jgi:hypothetical protein
MRTFELLRRMQMEKARAAGGSAPQDPNGLPDVRSEMTPERRAQELAKDRAHSRGEVRRLRDRGPSIMPDPGYLKLIR